MKTNYDTKVEYIEDNQNVSLPCIRLVKTLDLECSLHSSMIVAMATVLSTIFFVWMKYNVLYQSYDFLKTCTHCFNYKLTS